MDIQRKKGILDVCVLSVLQKEPSYGYMIVKEVSECIEISESTLYPILKRMENAGCLTTYKQEHNGRMRKYYEITDAGRKKIEEFLSEWDEIKRIYAFVQEKGKEER
nr:PadR family transcriptional regulator [uncultured Sellimonas sp.]